jgi:hypothetical protein
VRRCEDTFAELQKLLKGYSVAGGLGGGGVASGGLKNRVKYSFRKERIVFLRSSLDSYKTTLQLMLHVVERAPFLNGYGTRNKTVRYKVDGSEC